MRRRISFKHCPYLGPRAAQSGHYSAGWNSEHLSDLADFETFHNGQVHHFLVLWREPGESSSHLGVPADVFRPRQMRFFRLQRHFRSPTRSAQSLVTEINKDPKQPGFAVCARLKLAEVAPGSQQRFLNQIFGLRFATNRRGALRSEGGSPRAAAPCSRIRKYDPLPWLVPRPAFRFPGFSSLEHFLRVKGAAKTAY